MILVNCIVCGETITQGGGKAFAESLVASYDANKDSEKTIIRQLFDMPCNRCIAAFERINLPKLISEAIIAERVKAGELKHLAVKGA